MDLSHRFSLELLSEQQHDHTVRVFSYLYDLAVAIETLIEVSSNENEYRDTRSITLKELLVINALFDHVKNTPFKSLRALNRATLSDIPEGSDTSDIPAAKVSSLGSIDTHAYSQATSAANEIGFILHTLVVSESEESEECEDCNSGFIDDDELPEGLSL